MLCEHLAGVWFDFGLPDAGHAGAFEAKVDASDA
jgi:hypothetical protein